MNADLCKMYKQTGLPSQTMGEIEYRESVEPPELYNPAMRIARLMCEYPWTETYGLSYSETMDLPFSEVEMLRKALEKKMQLQERLANQADADGEDTTLKRLVKLLKR